MDRVLRRRVVTARKRHKCDACYWWHRSNYGVNDCTSSQWSVVLTAQADEWSIVPGQQYLAVTGVHDGVLSTYKARLDMQQLIEELDLVEE